jgi:hypothetical protein
MKCAERWKRLALAALLWGPLFVAGSDQVPIESVVVFNTQCARCHEGECSGRMSFNLPGDAADEHIRRYGGALPREAVRHLAALLRFMKEQCAFYPLPLALAEDHAWVGDTLDRLRAPDGTAYFLPLGRLGAGLYHLWLDGLDHEAGACTEVIAADFDLVGRQGIVQVGGRQGLGFRVENPAELFLRIRAKVPIKLTRVELVTSDPSGFEPK